MENSLIYIVIASLALNAVLMIALLVFVFKLLKSKGQQGVLEQQLGNISNNYLTTADLIEKKILESSSLEQKIETVSHNNLSGDYCIDHPSEVSIGNCAISGNAYCNHCLKTFQNVKVGKKFLNMYLASDWIDFLIIPKKDIYEDVDINLLELKRQLWEQNQLPVIVQNHHKINIDDDKIESFTVFKGRKADLDALRIRFRELSPKGIQ